MTTSVEGAAATIEMAARARVIMVCIVAGCREFAVEVYVREVLGRCVLDRVEIIIP